MRLVLFAMLLGCGEDLPPPSDLASDFAIAGDLAAGFDLRSRRDFSAGAQCSFSPTVQLIHGIVGWSADDLFALTGDGGTAAQLVHSRDRFATQTVLSTPTAFATIDRSSTGTLFATNGAGALYRSSDAGATWSGVPLPALANRVQAFPDGAVYLIGDTKLIVSHDDGGHWSLLDVGQSISMNEVYAVGDEIFVAGEFLPDGGHYVGAVAHSADAGSNWSLQVIDDPGIEASIWGSSADDVYVVGSDFAPHSLAHRSTDRGQTWTPLPVPQDGPLTDVRGSASRVRVVAMPLVLYSDDQGATWQTECQSQMPFGRMWADPAGGALVPLEQAAIAILP